MSGYQAVKKTKIDDIGGRAGRLATNPWEMSWPAWKEVLQRTWSESSDDNVGLVSAGVAFYGFLALVPMLGAIVITYGLVADPATVAKHAGSLTAVLPAQVADLIGDLLTNVVETSGDKKGLGLLLALAIALWGARNAAGAIITALDIAYEEEEDRSFVQVTLLALAMTAAAVVVAILAIGATTVLSLLHQFFPDSSPVAIILWNILSYALLAAAASAAIATLYRYGPSRDQAKWRWITPGSLFASLAWLLLTLGFGFYVRNFGNYDATYGSIGAVVVLLTWMYLSAYVLLFGAELNSELEHQTAQDTTHGPDQPLGKRGAWAADNVAGASGAEKSRLPKQGLAGTGDGAGPDRETADEDAARNGSRMQEVAASRVTARAAQASGLGKVGLISSSLATVGLAMLRRKGRATVGAALLATAAGLSLMKRSGP